MDKIESVVGKLMEELGSGGFMGIGDAQPGMHVVLVAKNGAQAAGTEVSTGKCLRVRATEFW